METPATPATGLPLVQALVAAPVALAGEDKPGAVAKRTSEQPEPNRRKRQRLLDDTQGHQFIALTRAHLASDMSERYQKILRRAAKLTPTERAALLTKLSGMIQEDQATSLQLLDQSIAVTEHFANKASE